MNIIIQYKTILIPVKCSKKDLDYLFNCNRFSAQIWNYCVGIDFEIKETNNYSLTRSDLQKLTKGIVPLHSKNIQHVVHDYIEARDAMWKSIKAKHENSNKVKLPYKYKKYFTSGWDYQCIRVDYEKGIIKLSKPRTTNKQPRPVKCFAKTIPKNIVEIELIYTHKLMLAIKYKEEISYLKITSNNEASIDLGEIHAITSIDNNGNTLIITGRKMRSDKRLRNKEQGKLRKRMSKCIKGSRQYKKYRKALNNLVVKFHNKELDSIHKITKLYVDYCIQRDISTVYYGDLDSCTRDTKKRVGKVVGQKLNQWSYGLLMRQLENKLFRFDIKLAKVKEYYTSKKCPSCKKLNKPKGRNYTCKCGYIQHRDIVGAINILNDNGKFNIKKYNNLKYLQIA